MIKIYEDLGELGVLVFAEGDAPAELPNKYYTFSEDDTSDNLNANNKTLEILYEFTLKYYTTDATDIYDGTLRAIRWLKVKGYIISGVGQANGTYEDKWFSRMVSVKKIEYIKED